MIIIDDNLMSLMYVSMYFSSSDGSLKVHIKITNTNLESLNKSSK